MFKIGDLVKVKKGADLESIDVLKDVLSIEEMQDVVCEVTRVGYNLTSGANVYDIEPVKYHDKQDLISLFTWTEDVLELVEQEQVVKEKFTKGVDNSMIQDFYRGVMNENGNIQFNHIKMVNLCFVKHDNCDKIYMFNNPTDRRLKSGTKVIVDTKYGKQKAIVVSSIKLPKKYLRDLQIAMIGKYYELKDVLGVVTDKTVKLEVEEYFK